MLNNPPRKSGRRSQGSGSVFRSGKYWKAQVLVGYGEDGKAIYKRVQRKSEAEAVEALNRMLGTQVIGGHVKTDDRMTLETWLEIWLEHIKANREPKTYAYYEMFVRLHIAPKIGKVRLTKVTATDVQKLLNEARMDQQISVDESGHPIIKPGLKPRALDALRATLRAAFSVARKRRLIAENPASLTDTVKVPRVKPAFLTPDEVAKLTRHLQGNQVESLTLLALGSGMRIGEITGLRWSDVDFDLGKITVGGQLQRVGGKLVVKGLKTSTAHRPLPMTEMARRALHIEKARQLLVGVDNPLGLAMLNGAGRPWDQRHANRLLAAAMEEACLKPLSFHKLRHTAASALLAAGVPMFEVSRILGHSSVVLTTSTYGHVLPDSIRRAGEALDRMYGIGG